MSNTMTEVQHHQWVKYTRTPVALVPDLDDDRQMVAIEELTPEQQEEGAVYGCNRCGSPMEGNTDTLCEGENND